MHDCAHQFVAKSDEVKDSFKSNVITLILESKPEDMELIWYYFL